jgi:hypothetical protein
MAKKPGRKKSPAKAKKAAKKPARKAARKKLAAKASRKKLAAKAPRKAAKKPARKPAPVAISATTAVVATADYLPPEPTEVSADVQTAEITEESAIIDTEPPADRIP